MIVPLARVLFLHPLPDFGDRAHQGLSTVISNEEWHIETDLHHGRISDVVIYRNKNHHAMSKPGVKADWEWYAGIPTANIKGYRLGGVLPDSELLMAKRLEGLDAEPEAETAKDRRATSSAAE